MQKTRFWGQRTNKPQIIAKFMFFILTNSMQRYAKCEPFFSIFITVTAAQYVSFYSLFLQTKCDIKIRYGH